MAKILCKSVLLLLSIVLTHAQENALTNDVGDAGNDNKLQTVLEIHEILRRAASGVDFHKNNGSEASEDSGTSSLKCSESVSFSKSGEKTDSSGKALEKPLICLTVKSEVESNGEKFPMVSRFGAPESSPVLRQLKMEKKDLASTSTCFPAPPRSPLGIAVKSTTFQVETSQVCVCAVEDFCNDK